MLNYALHNGNLLRNNNWHHLHSTGLFLTIIALKKCKTCLADELFCCIWNTYYFFLWIWSYYLMFFWGEFLIAEAKLEKHNTKPFAELFCCLMLNFVKNQLMTFVLVELNVIWSIRIHFGELVPFFSHSLEEEKVTPLSSPSAVLQILGKWMIKDWRNAQGVTGIALASSELVSWCWNPKALLTGFRSSFVKPVGSRN